MGRELFAKPSKDKLLSDLHEASFTVTADFLPGPCWEKEKVMCEERWGKGNNRLGERLVAEHKLTNFKKKRN